MPCGVISAAVDFTSKLDPHAWPGTCISLLYCNFTAGYPYASPSTVIGVLGAQVLPRILHPNWTLIHGLEHVYPLLYCNFTAGYPYASPSTVIGVLGAQVLPRILHPNWTLTYGLEHVYPLLYCNFTAGFIGVLGAQVLPRILHPNWTLTHGLEHCCHGFYIQIGPSHMAWNTYILCCIAISLPDCCCGFYTKLDPHTWPGTRISFAVLQFHCRICKNCDCTCAPRMYWGMRKGQMHPYSLPELTSGSEIAIQQRMYVFQVMREGAIRMVMLSTHIVQLLINAPMQHFQISISVLIVYCSGSDPRVNPAVPMPEWVWVETLTRWGYGFHGFGCAFEAFGAPSAKKVLLIT
ncbi:hypothetical protein GGX14DRAFT_393313 [Mycena pura]|uniref:Uncharacterized protein n=1 Tax=Mycena pura TaxID=153505 RepID=A0AAD6YC90_9AGAR|nr:hypothetical protein GGX14DRAFT_393313 [Mycena pura]